MELALFILQENIELWQSVTNNY